MTYCHGFRMPTAAMILATAFWASSWVANKSVLSFIGPAETVTARFTLAALVLWVLVMLSGDLRAMRRVGFRPLLMGLLEPGLAGLLITWGLTMTSALSATVFLSLMPVLMPLLGRLVLGEAVRPVIYLAAAIAFVGTALLLWGQAGHGGGSAWGNFIVALGVLTLCLNQLLARRVAQAYGRPVVVSAWQLTAAAVLALLVMLTVERPADPYAGANAVVWSSLAYIAIVGTCCTFLLYNYALRHMPVGRISLFVCLVTPLSAPMAAWYLGTRVTVLDYTAITVVLAGVLLPSWRIRE
ncbi:MAG: DMT family transporter [Alphaproteobacteria bacterium]|jgi:drug/metabolite transporter (DMT)-like permease|nr:DMT family transporter [Alphaproteobacteria bacterium]